jgi:hypothetical protein
VLRRINIIQSPFARHGPRRRQARHLLFRKINAYKDLGEWVLFIPRRTGAPRGSGTADA